MEMTLLHTATIHRSTFDRLRKEYAPDVKLCQIIRPDWLDAARKGIDARLEKDIKMAIQAAHGPVLCTCTTIAPLAVQHGAERIDMPMMTEAAAHGGNVLLVYTLSSTRETSQSLLQQALDQANNPAQIHLLDLSAFWPLFEAGELTAFHASIAAGVRDALPGLSNIGAVVLAQASMAEAAKMLQNLSQSVFTSPETAFRHMLKRLK